MKKILDFIYDNALNIVGISALTTFLVFIFMCLFADHKIRYYYMTQTSDRITISKDIDWEIDESITLDKTMTYDEALDMLDRLNATIKK